MKLSELLDSQLIFTELESLEKERFLREIISRISDVQSSIKESTVIDLILKREKLCSTALDNFIAIPHAKIPGIDKTYISLCISNNGIDFGSIDGLKTKILILILSMTVFTIYNSFGKNFMGDGAIYGVSFLVGYILVKLSSLNYSVSPYFIANLLWYPAFENLFTIIRRLFNKKKNYLPDNGHLHQILFKFLDKKKIIKKKYLLSTFVGISINLLLTIFYTIGYMHNDKTNIQIYLIFIGILIYLFIFFRLKKFS